MDPVRHHEPILQRRRPSVAPRERLGLAEHEQPREQMLCRLAPAPTDDAALEQIVDIVPGLSAAGVGGAGAIVVVQLRQREQHELGRQPEPRRS